jgi:enolase-phosphatase E1
MKKIKTQAILTDIEGTTSSISFVKDVLFPYSRNRMAEFIRVNPVLVEPYLQAVRTETGKQDTQSCIDLLLEWHDQDRKAYALKALQGLIWREGYVCGALRGHVYSDTAPALRRWKAMGIRLYVYSSGSVAAQKLIFGYSLAGDLTYLFSGYFDTAIGSKLQADSYQKISQQIGIKPQNILFLSDNVLELQAAQQASFMTLGLERENVKLVGFETKSNFQDIVLP